MSSSGGIHTHEAYTKLERHAKTFGSEEKLHLRTLLQDGSRNSQMTVNSSSVLLDYSRQNATAETLRLLTELAQAANLDAKKRLMLSGAKINSTEDRAVLHVALRAKRDAVYSMDGANQVPLVYEVLDRIKNFSDRVRSGAFKGASGKVLKNIISVGIGGSYLGPEFVYEALKVEPVSQAAAKGLTLRFLANVDPVDVARATHGLDPTETLVIVVSKTFTTAETMLNARTMKKWLLDGFKSAAPSVTEANVAKHHIVAASTNLQLTGEFGIDPQNVFGFWDWVGGRYSVWSAVGMLPLSIYYGFEIMEQFLAGGRAMDEHFASKPINENIPTLMGLLGLWNSTFLKHSCRAILPYAQALIRFPAHVQQLDMESNGKRVSMDGSVLPFEAGEIIFGEPGTNGQHSFYQLIHQGRTIPCEFIGYCHSQTPMSLAGEKVSNHDELMSNYFAQADALAYGKTAAQLKAEKVPDNLISHKTFPGNRPSMSLLFKKLDAFSAGQLLAIYEHRVFVEGAIWGINSFDQWGVELGKVLAGQVRNQLNQSRSATAAAPKEIAATFNSSTKSMLQFYLQSK